MDWESIAAVSEVADHCYSVSLSDDDEGLINVFNKYCDKNNFSRFFSKYKNNVTHFEGDSTTFNYSKNIKNKIDLVFIDGVHSYQGIYRDTNEIMKFTGYDETIVVWHDFRTGRNEIIENTVEAILDVLQEKYKFSFSFKQDPNEIYSYEVKIFPKFNSLEV